ncbi:MAG: PleD family two-component system response regulator [Thermodesulfovibrionales bacterium]
MGGKLLLADDSITIQKVVELVLAEEGFEIKAVNSGEEALATIQSFKPDVVLADIEMPKMNGYQLCERIKTDPLTRDIPVILLAGAFEPIDEELARNVGADDYIIKPFESQELISKINSALTAKEMAGEEIAVETPVEEAEAFEAGVAGEELWTMEELASEQLVSEGIAEETPLEVLEEAVAEEAPSIVEEVPEAFVSAPEETIVQPQRPAFAVPEVEVPSKEEIMETFRTEIRERIVPLMSDMKESFIANISPYIKDSAEKVLWEVVPDLVERLLKEMVQGALASLTKEVEKVIWETVPDLAETLIKREIEKIKSET